MTLDLTPSQARQWRLASLQLADHPAVPRPGDVADVVTWLGALQAQDVGSSLWSLGVRLPHLDLAGVLDCLERRQAVRTWPMRGTIHLVPGRDARWMVEIIGERALAHAAKRREILGLEESVADRAVEVIGEALAGGRRLSRPQILEYLQQRGVPVTGQLGYHLLWYASQRGVSCVAPNVDGEQTFVLLDEWVPDPHTPDRDEALATMAVRFVRGHGPVPMKDFVGWTGLTAGDAKRGVAAAGDRIATITCDGAPMLVDAAALAAGPPAAADDAPCLLLPGFDEFILGYKERSLMLTPEQFAVVVPGGNGIFQPTYSRAGRVRGTWRRKRLTSRSRLELTPLADLDDADLAAVDVAAAGYARFLGEPVEVRVV